jgi:hypothetical protein
MALIWMKRETPAWAVLPLEAERIRLDTEPPRRLQDEAIASSDADGVLLLRQSGEDGTVWILLAGTRWDVRVNGLPLHAGIRVLADRDEIRIGGMESCYFSTEESPRVVPFPEASANIHCPRCTLEIQPGGPAVRCPNCAVWHHQDPDRKLPCWTYGERCGGCDLQETSSEAEFRWTPCGL